MGKHAEDRHVQRYLFDDLFTLEAPPLDIPAVTNYNNIDSDEYAREYFKKYWLAGEQRRAADLAQKLALKEPGDDDMALVVMAGEKSGYQGALFATTRRAGLKFCGLEGTEGRGKYGLWSTFCTTYEMPDHNIFINDDGRFDILIKNADIPVFFRVKKSTYGTTKNSSWFKTAQKKWRAWHSAKQAGGGNGKTDI